MARKTFGSKTQEQQMDHIEELASELYALVSYAHSDRGNTDRLEEDIENELKWELIRNRRAGFDNMLETMSNEVLGKLLRYYLTEADHQGWDGFSFEELLGMSAFLRDLALTGQHTEEYL